ISKVTHAIAVIVSENGIVPMFEGGALVGDIIPELWLLSREHVIAKPNRSVDTAPPAVFPSRRFAKTASSAVFKASRAAKTEAPPVFSWLQRGKREAPPCFPPARLAKPSPPPGLIHPAREGRRPGRFSVRTVRKDVVLAMFKSSRAAKMAAPPCFRPDGSQR